MKRIRAVPLLQVERGDLALRAENIYALSLAGISDTQDELLTMSDLKDFAPFPAQKFALVDHNRLGATFTKDNPDSQVVAVLDHHEDEGLHLDANPRVIAPCGSCASHVVPLLPHHYPPEIGTLLLTAIMIDTDGLKPGGKALDLDKSSALAAAFQSTFSNRIPPPSALAPIDQPRLDALHDTQAMIDLNAALQGKKDDVSHLGAVDLLRRDYKEYVHPLPWVASGENDPPPTVQVGLATVPLRLKDWGSGGKLEKAALEWMTKRQLSVLGVLTTFRDKAKGKNGKGAHKREMAWVVLAEPEINSLSKSGSGCTVEAVAKRLWSGLEAEGNLELKKHNKFDLLTKGDGRLPKTAAVRVYKQGNAKATRKLVAPVVKSILEQKFPAEEKPKKKAAAL